MHHTVTQLSAWACAVAGLILMTGCEIGTEAQPPGAAAPAAENQSARVARGNLKFIEGYSAGLAQARSQSKPVLVFFTAEWCHFCHQMADEAFTHPQVVSLADHFVCVLVDADREPQVCRQFNVTGYPTIQFLSPRGAPLARIVGKKPGHQLMMAMQAALQGASRRDDVADRRSPR
jgi:thiol:disulfide interchange protein